MSTILTTTISRSSLSDPFYFESVINYTLTTEGINEYISVMGTGFITTTVDSSITWDEIVDRQSELRPDQIYMLDHKDDGISLTTSIRPAFKPGPQNQPPFNPFSLTYSWSHEYDTLEHLLAAYSTIWTYDGRTTDEEAVYRQEALTAYNNTAVERCYVDGTEVAFTGKW